VVTEVASEEAQIAVVSEAEVVEIEAASEEAEVVETEVASEGAGEVAEEADPDSE
jgi:hypothetical protein